MNGAGEVGLARAPLWLLAIDIVLVQPLVHRVEVRNQAVEHNRRRITAPSRQRDCGKKGAICG